jgi:hypothetical protein
MKIKWADVILFCQIIEDEFELKSTPQIIIKKQITYFGCEVYGMYQGFLKTKGYKHKIWLDEGVIENKLQLFATLAHEYVHAWQTENMLKLTHGAKNQFTDWNEYFCATYNIDLIGINTK